jgi:hypothetical protein
MDMMLLLLIRNAKMFFFDCSLHPYEEETQVVKKVGIEINFP